MTQSGFAPAAAVQVRACLSAASPCMSPSAPLFRNPPLNPRIRPSPSQPDRALSPHPAPRAPQPSAPRKQAQPLFEPPVSDESMCALPCPLGALQLTRAVGGGGGTDVAKQGGAEPPRRLHPGSALRVCCRSALADAKARQGARRRRSCALAHAGRVKAPPCGLVCAQDLSRPSSCASKRRVAASRWL